MQDLDSAVGKLDDILIAIYVIIAILIIAVALVTHSLMFSVWLVHPHLFFSGSSVDYSRDWCWRLDSRFVSSVCNIIDIKPLAFF